MAQQPTTDSASIGHDWAKKAHLITAAKIEASAITSARMPKRTSPAGCCW
jgi:hypothetical protein